jgi:Type VI secretion system, TssN
MLSIAGIGGFSLMTFLGIYIGRARGSFAPYRKRTIIYLLISMLIFAVIGLCGVKYIFGRPAIMLGVCQIIFLALGFLHLRDQKRYLKWAGQPDSFWFELIFAFAITAFGYLTFSLIFRLVNREGYEFLLATSTFFFMAAFLIQKTFNLAISIPPKVYRTWSYPVLESVADPDETRLKHMMVISFEFQKKATDKYFTNFRAKAPVDMFFGELFYFFINDYNERHPGERIQFVNDKNQPYGWIFYKKPKWHTVFTKYINTDLSFFINSIRENDVIVCVRV